MNERLTSSQIATRAGHAIHRVDQWGARGVSMVTFDEIEALVIVAALAGLTPVPPGQAMETTDMKGDSHVQD